MKHFILYTSLLLTCCSAMAKDLSEYYTMRPRANDLLFFILPIKMESTVRGVDNAEFDITYITSETNATINMSIYANVALQADSIVFCGDKLRYSSKNFETFYIEKEGKKWAHRYSCKVPFEFLQHLYALPDAWQLEIYAKGQKFHYRQGNGTWKIEQKRMIELLMMIQINKKK